jgi:hypothetical protein
MKSFFKIKTGHVVILSILVLPLLIAAYFFFSHSNKEEVAFYKEPMVRNENDVWRLPLIEPYELITADCCKAWNFQKSGFQANFTADSVNLENDCIIFYGYPNEYGLLDIKRKRIVRFNNYRQFADALNARGISAKLFYTETVYNNWCATGQLPWAQEILAIQKGDPDSK